MPVHMFLSLSFTDAAFVRSVSARLPRGVARFYEQSFDRGEDLVSAMERNLDDSEVFVLFASKESLGSYAVGFEIDEARYRVIAGRIKRVLVFPIEPGVTFADLPPWLQRSWVPNVGESPADIARYLTGLLLEPDRGLSPAAPKVIGRGSAVDRLERLVAAHMQRRRKSPHVFIFPGISGIGRRTFAAYYLRKGLGSEANLAFGPSLSLSAQAELVDLYRALRVEIDPAIPVETLAQEQEAFTALSSPEQITEVVRVLGHFGRLGQAVTIASAAGFFEDAATPKSWVAPLLTSIPPDQIFILVSNLQFRDEYVASLECVVQMRVEELDGADIKVLTTFTAANLGLDSFEISDRLIAAIGGHPDVANAAVKLARQKGSAILERDPRQLFNIQQAIIGEATKGENLNRGEQFILSVLGWVPNLGADLLEKVVVERLRLDAQEFNDAIEGLILGCLIYATGYRYSIAPSVRQLYRRENVTGDIVLEAMSSVFAEEWSAAETRGFRDDLFSAFVFMQLLEGKSLPPQLRRLLTPGNLHDAVRETYARGKESDDVAAIEQAIEWGKVALEMTMSDGVREEILSTVARAQIRIGKWRDADEIIAFMRRQGYRSVTFLEGHSLRKRRKFDDAIPKLRYVVDNFRHNRAAVHELALCYRRQRRWKDLEQLLDEHGEAVRDSPIFLDFNIGLNIARSDLSNVPTAIARLRAMDDNPTRADLRQAQLLSKLGQHKAAKDFLTHVIATGGRRSMQLRTLRAVEAARSNDIKLAREDLAFIKSLPNGDARANSLEAEILLVEGRPKLALEHLHSPQEPGDWLMRANIMDAIADHPDTGIEESQAMRRESSEIRGRYAGDPEFLFDD